VIAPRLAHGSATGIVTLFSNQNSLRIFSEFSKNSYIEKFFKNFLKNVETSFSEMIYDENNDFIEKILEEYFGTSKKRFLGQLLQEMTKKRVSTRRWRDLELCCHWRDLELCGHLV
jgi:hypothetical protein